ncbi:DNA helicase/exodeoxyribonuclease V, beta subunit [Desulfacinum hydrothermale DSM 13146]|uniref:DNA 3'-5' helicase n=1 Tax=Desulfacinum hydrothermale DSM 13146 TaxID=1121390 RepID=A0A1W1XCY8_9BACT|nr:exodeoxyribonuclease V subunit beta [Desulfacinum hydrothermale]SMC21674.1 DNA helicase/exodeoxyribonuclease V, beta subunit [Desulfacinum hydrothermale DSM 13146]
MNSLEPLKMPLKGLRLIEASAGTGKTYNIVLLFLRALLERDLDIGHILVVTFTNAATEELRERLRHRLRQAVQVLFQRAGGVDVSTDDPLLNALLVQRDSADLLRAAWKLREAASRLDEAPIFTIHGFCRRMLQEFAFETGAPFQAELISNEEEIRRQAAADFWRRALAEAEETEARWFLETWGGPDGLLESLDIFRGATDIKVLPQLNRPKIPCFRDLGHLFQAVRDGWKQYREEIEHLFKTSKALNRRSYNKSVIQSALEAMDALASQGSTPLVLPEAFRRFTPAMLEEKGTKNGYPTPTHPFFERCGRFLDCLEETKRLQKICVLQNAWNFLEEETAQRKALEECLSFDDLLNILDRALDGPSGPDLAQGIRLKYPMALIDEFQDTDPVQYRIFQRIYELRQTPQPLCLIGDPKQAIYSFRGADIFAYIQARRDAGSQNIYTMDTNWRSASHLVQAINRLFRRAPAPFIYKEDIPFHPVESARKADAAPLVLPESQPGKPPAALRIRFLRSERLELTQAGDITKKSAREAAAADCAGEIARLLNWAADGQARIGESPLQARDIAVLVRSHREGAIVQRALRKQGIASVSLQRESVFSSREADELLSVLAALAAPSDQRLLRAALATEMLGWDVPRLQELNDDETLMESVQQRFSHYHDLWQRRGFLPAFMELLKGEKVVGRLRSLPEGERRLTNTLHLLELLHEAAQTHTGTERLCRWLQEKRASHPTADEEQLRLESDENLVQVVTIHRSKGLEYPVVFVPFPWSDGPPQGKGPVRFHDPNDLKLTVDLGSDQIDAHRKLEEQEDLAERMRLLYVALTRAKYLCVVTWGKINGASRSAMARLLFPDSAGGTSDVGAASRMEDLDEEAMRRELAELADDSQGTIAVEDAKWETPEKLHDGGAHQTSHLSARTFSGKPGPEWRITSYSNLVAGADPHEPDYDAVPSLPLETPPEDVSDPAFLFPRGPRPGECLHEIMENLDFPTAQKKDLETVVGDVLSRYGLDRSWTPKVIPWVNRVLETPFSENGENGLKLRDIQGSDRLNELEFHYPVGSLTPELLRRAVQGDSFYERSLEGLGFGEIQGLMRGFIDLVFRAHGRYYIVDYKSNHLGNRVEDYGRDALERAMRQHRYPLQMLVYTLAVHRYLKTRISSYDYDRHFGGVYYLFLRGMRPEKGASTGVFHHRPSRKLVERLNEMLAGGQEPT